MLDRLFQTTPCFADLIQYTEVVECPENVVLQEHLKSYAARCNTPYAWLTLDDKVCAATNKWYDAIGDEYRFLIDKFVGHRWKLPGSERNLLSILGKAISPAVKSFDIPIYLPQTSPSVRHCSTNHRFQSIQLSYYRSRIDLSDTSYHINATLLLY